MMTGRYLVKVWERHREGNGDVDVAVWFVAVVVDDFSVLTDELTPKIGSSIPQLVKHKAHRLPSSPVMPMLRAKVQDLVGA